MSDIAISQRQIILIGALLNEYDRLAANYETIPSSDPGLRAMYDMERRLINVLRTICHDGELATTIELPETVEGSGLK